MKHVILFTAGLLLAVPIFVFFMLYLIFSFILLKHLEVMIHLSAWAGKRELAEVFLGCWRMAAGIK